MAQIQSRGKTESVLQIRMPRTKLLSVQERPEVLLRYREVIPEEQNGKDLRGLLLVGVIRPHHKEVQ